MMGPAAGQTAEQCPETQVIMTIERRKIKVSIMLLKKMKQNQHVTQTKNPSREDGTEYIGKE